MICDELLVVGVWRAKILAKLTFLENFCRVIFVEFGDFEGNSDEILDS